MSKSMPPRVLYSFPHALGAPGIGTTAEHQVRGLHALGAQVTVWCTTNVATLPAGVCVVESMRRGPVRVPHRAVGVGRAYRWHDRQVAAALASGRERFDVVHTWPLGALATLTTARRLGVPGMREVPNTHTANAFAQVQREHELLSFPVPPHHSHTPSPAKLAREEAEYSAAAALLVPSDYVRESFLRFGIPADRLARHRYGFDPDRFHPAPKDPDRPFTAVFVGSGEPRKGVHYALEAWRRSGAGVSSRLLLCGRFDPAYAAHLGAALEQPGVVRHDFHPRVDEVLRQADVLLLPSVEEGSALVTYEAMGSGCVPLVSTAVGSGCTHGVDGLVHEPRDVDALTEHLMVVRNDAAELTRLRSGAVASSRALTWQAAGETLLLAYEQAASRVGVIR